MILSMSAAVYAAGENLDESSQRLYDQLMPELLKIANGQRESTEIKIAFDGQGAAEQSDVIAALLYECPYELYWFDKKAGVQYYSTLDNEYTFSFSVTKEYAGSEQYTIDIQKAAAAAEAFKNADKIIDDCAGLGDYEKIRAYRSKICELASYDDIAAKTNDSDYGDPWQIINVFDGDSSTKSVCEGYSKAFQYLMDNSSFNSNKIGSILVDGGMTGATGSGAHMWNVVRMDDGKNYLVDVTNCDSGTVGYPEGLFLKGGKGKYVGGYTVVSNSTNAIKYTYTIGTLEYYKESQLELSDEDYIRSSIDDYMIVGDNVIATVENGVATLSGSGSTWYYSYVPGVEEPPFKDLGITRVVVNEGITDLDSGLFESCADLKSVQLPDGLKSIGFATFAGCSKLETINIPEGVESIGWFAFQECRALTELYLPESITEIGASAFAQCENLTSLNIPKKITRIESNFIDECSKLKSINIPEGVTFIDFSAFANSGITSIKLPEGIESIEQCTFWGCWDLRELEIPKSVKTIGSSAFFNTIDLKVTIHESVESIDDTAFDEAIRPVICGKVGSVAEAYAKKHGIKFVSLDKAGEAVDSDTSAKDVEAAIAGMKSDSDLPGSVFNKLQLRSTKQTSTSISLSWKKVAGAKTYVIYGNKCGKANKMKRIAKSTGKSRKITKILGKKLRKGTYYKFMIVALDENNKVVSASRLIHVATKGGKAGNYTRITTKAKNNKVSLKKGKTFKLGAKATGKNVKKHAAVRYESSNPKVAKVNKSGKITAKKKGTCKIYVYAQNGIYKIIKIRVM